MIQVHTDGLQTFILLIIWGVTSIQHTFSILSSPSMIEFRKIWYCLNWLSSWYRFIESVCKQITPCLSRVSINTAHISNFINVIYDWIFKTLINGHIWLSRWYRFIQAGCKQLSPYLSSMSYQYCTHFQFCQCHLWLKFLKLW